MATDQRDTRVRLRPLLGRSASAAGSVSVQAVILLPLMFSIMFLGMQGALYYHARSVAIAASQEGARAAGSEQPGDGPSAAADFIEAAGGDDVLRSVSIDSNRSATSSTVTVSGSSMSVFPGWSPQVTQSATVPVERITE